MEETLLDNRLTEDKYQCLHIHVGVIHNGAAINLEVTKKRLENTVLYESTISALALCWQITTLNHQMMEKVQVWTIRISHAMLIAIGTAQIIPTMWENGMRAGGSEFDYPYRGFFFSRSRDVVVGASIVPRK